MHTEEKMKPNLSPLGVLAFSIGTSIGWGSLVVTSNTYLAQAGPWGSTIGMLVGCAVMLVISRSYAYLIRVFPESGGAYTYAKRVLGYDYGFLTAWFLGLTYLAILWANATSIPLFMRFFIGDFFKYGRVYALFGYDVYLGEALLSVCAILVVAALCSSAKQAVAKAMTAMAFVFSVAIAICFFCGITGHGIEFRPGFVPNRSCLTQVARIAVISPWAYIGFESISHAAEEMKFRTSAVLHILRISVIATTVLYIFITLLSATAYPPEYASWLDYIRDYEHLDGIKGLPAFYAAAYYLGDTGVFLLMCALLALILTSLVGNISAVSRLFYALGHDGVLPSPFGQLNQHRVPEKSILLIVILSIVFPFLGRTAIGWIVDVTTIGATMIYGIVSAAAAKLARERGDRMEYRLGALGLVCMIGFGVYLLAPNLYTSGTMARESYFFFLVWAILGFICFRTLLIKDTARRFGKSLVVWVALFLLVLFISLVYLRQSVLNAVNSAVIYLEHYYTQLTGTEAHEQAVAQQLETVSRMTGNTMSIILIIIAIALGSLVSIFKVVAIRLQSTELQLGEVKKIAGRDSLTGVGSRHAFSEMEKALENALSGGEIDPFGFVVFDVNGLKEINDTLGHKAGDVLLKQASRLICDYYTHSPVYRNGGDEFIAYLSGRDYADREQLLSAFHDNAVKNIGSAEAVVAAGCAEYRPGMTVHEVFQKADAAMYREKELLKQLGAKPRRSSIK